MIGFILLWLLGICILGFIDSLSIRNLVKRVEVLERKTNYIK